METIAVYWEPQIRIYGVTTVVGLSLYTVLFPAEQTRIVKLLVEKVIVSPNDLEVRLRANGIERLVLELRPEPVEQQVEALA